VLVAIALARGQLRYGDPLMLAVGLNAAMLVAGGIMVHAVGREGAVGPARWLDSGVLPTLGKYSYGLYLWHQPAILWLAGAGVTAALVPPVFGSRLPGLLLVGLLAGALSLGATLLSWRLIEQPFARLKERLTARPVP
jgi:peptidoglycan/LPS O-acetylase OafA/YrhL